jgi:hypothetical protein
MGVSIFVADGNSGTKSQIHPSAYAQAYMAIEANGGNEAKARLPDHHNDGKVFAGTAGMAAVVLSGGSAAAFVGGASELGAFFSAASTLSAWGALAADPTVENALGVGGGLAVSTIVKAKKGSDMARAAGEAGNAALGVALMSAGSSDAGEGSPDRGASNVSYRRPTMNAVSGDYRNNNPLTSRLSD